MNKPYKEVFWLSYQGIMIVKQFNKRKKSNENSTNKDKISQCQDNSGVHETSSVSNDSNGIRKHRIRYRVNKSKVRKRAIAFSRLKKSRKNFYFYTITFPSQLPDNQCFECLNIALTRLRKEKYIQDYLWVTERQKNGTLHFHMLTNDYFSVRTLNNFVKASLIYKLNRKEFSYDRTKIENYNGVDIMKNRTTGKVINLAKQKDNKLIISYITKYITKNEGEFSRLPFHSSHTISKLTNKYLIDQYEAQIIWDNHQAHNQNPKKWETEYCTIVFFSNNVDEEIFTKIDELNEALYNIRQ